MPKAIAKCTCKVCGKEFERWEKKKTDRDAEFYIAWAERFYDKCSQCYYQEKKDKASDEYQQLKEAAKLPEIEGVSEKQIKYAEDLRKHIIVSCAGTVRLMLRLESRVDWEKKAAEMGKSKEEILEQYGFKTIWFLRNCSNAKEIINYINDLEYID